uniref:Uncharacterized protein n=1 Tax=Panagrolaimus davidi TaxID=227884 RepID=A0A914P581_9BILA
MHNLLENERAENKRIQDELFGVKRSEQKKDGIILELENELGKTRKITKELNDEMKKRIEDLLKEVGDKSAERNAAKMEKKEAEERLEAIEENYKLKTTFLEEHSKKLQSEIGILTKKKIFLNERIRNLSEELAILRQKLMDADFDYFGDDEVKALIKEQKAIIESTRAENTALKDELKKMKSVRK